MTRAIDDLAPLVMKLFEKAMGEMGLRECLLRDLAIAGRTAHRWLIGDEPQTAEGRREKQRDINALSRVVKRAEYYLREGVDIRSKEDKP